MHSIVQHALIIAEQALLYLPLICGGYLAMSLMKIPNLSIESALITGAMAGSLVHKLCATGFLVGHSGACFSIALLSAALAAGAVGSMAGLLHAYGKISHLLSSIIIIGFIHGLSLIILRGSHITLDSQHNALNLFTLIPLHPTLTVLSIIGAMTSLCMYFLFKTKLGITCVLYGDNPRFLTSHKIETTYIICIGLSIANALAGISGFLIAQNNGFIDTSMAKGIPLLCITALMLGGAVYTKMRPIMFTLPLIGTVCYFSLQSLLLGIGFDLHYFTLVQALILMLIFLTRRSSNFALGV